MEKREKIPTLPHLFTLIMGDNVWLGANVSILSGVTIGNNTVVGCGPANSLAVGNPATVIKTIGEAN